MIALNLLSPDRKKALRARVTFAMLERLMIAAAAALLTASILLLLVKIRLTRNLGEVQERQILSTEYVTANNSIRQLNALINRVDALQKLAISPSSLILDVARRTPAGVTVTGLDFDVKSESMRLNGIAATREDLLAYETAVRESPFVKKLDSPISNLFQKANIAFQFKIVLDVPALKSAYAPAP